MDSLKQYRKAIDLAVYGVALLCTLLFAVYSVWGFGISGFTILFEASFIGGLLLILAPVMGIVLELVLAKNMDERTQMIVNLVICIAGVLLLFIAKGIAAGEGACGNRDYVHHRHCIDLRVQPDYGQCQSGNNEKAAYRAFYKNGVPADPVF